MPSETRDSAGFTLMEVLIAMLVLSVALVTILTTAGRMQDAVIGADEILTSQYFAQESMGAVEVQGAGQWLSMSGEYGEPFQDYAYEVDIRPTDIEGLRYVRFTVLGPDEASNVVLEKLVYDR